MAIHCHQPVGNFGFVFEEAYTQAYDPFLRVLERHPGVRLALHYSGCLLDWLREHHPGFLDRVRALMSRGQVELLASGYYEPILPLIPEPDRQGQIAQMRAALRTHFHAKTSGLWLTERVWEPDLPASLARAGIRYTMVDVNQFAGAKPWLPSALQVQDDLFWDLLGCYTSEYAGSSVLLFPASKRLRYWMPFQRVEQTIEFLKRLQRNDTVAITFADDGEKFGLWPKTHRWVYEEGWLDQFFAALERERAWLTTTTFHDYVEEVGPSGSVYLPGGSYEEMLEWSGGHFRNFFTKYPEANAMQQKMLRVSRALQSCTVNRVNHGPRTSRKATVTVHGERLTVHRIIQLATRELYAGQCNCAYWHGVFGGLYLSHLRRAVYAHLIAAEQLANQVMDHTIAVTALDADGDGQEEASLRTATMGLLVDPAEGGTVTEWNLYEPRINLLDTLSRRPEPYHDKLKVKHAQAAVPAGGAPASIHDIVGVKEQNLASHLVYDDHRRSAFLDYALQEMPTLQEIMRSTWGERRLWSAGPFQWDRQRLRKRATGPLRVTMVRDLSGGRIRKSVCLALDRPVLECRYELEGLSVPVVGLEFNLSLRDERYLVTAGQHVQVTQFRIEEPEAGVSLSLSIDPPASVMHFPIETISESEGGLERTYQGLCLVCFWQLEDARSPAGRARDAAGWTSRVRWMVQTCPSSPLARSPARISGEPGRVGQPRAPVEPVRLRSGVGSEGTRRAKGR
jgi:alpha-amylase